MLEVYGLLAALFVLATWIAFEKWRKREDDFERLANPKSLFYRGAVK